MLVGGASSSSWGGDRIQTLGRPGGVLMLVAG